MDRVAQSLPLQCTDHRNQIIGMLNTNLNAEKIGFCYECIAENCGDSSLLKALKPVSSYLKDSSNFYEKCRQRTFNAGEPPVKYIEELSRKGERLEKLSKHIDDIKDNVAKKFEGIRKAVVEIIDQKANECFELLDKEISGLSEAYVNYEKILMIGWPKPSDIQNIFPGTDILEQKMSQIENTEQLRAFMLAIQEDVKMQDLYFEEEDGVFKIEKKLNGLIRGFSLSETSLPKIQSTILDSENVTQGLMKEFIQQKVHVVNSIGSRMKASVYESKIIMDDQFEILRDWLPKEYKFDLKLLFRGSADGMSCEKFHEKCDGKGATITLVRCRFVGSESSSTIGGFVEQSWHSNSRYSSSKQAFLFSLTEEGQSSVKCPILESHFLHAMYGHPQCGPRFGSGSDLYLRNGLTIGSIEPKSYFNSIALRDGDKETFHVEEIEVFKVE